MRPSHLLRALMLLSAGCDAARAEPLLARAGIEVEDSTANAFSLPLPALTAAERSSFFVGNSYFNQNWVSAPASVTTRDGLGPLFNARSCSGCHFKDGRGRPPEPGEPLRSMLVRISTPARGAHGEPMPDPRYGDQLQGDAIPGVAREAEVRVHYREEPGRFADGQAYSLRVPTLQVSALGHGPVVEGLQTSARVAPAMVGLGLLESVAARDVLRRADPEDRDHDGISGRANLVWSAANQRLMLGRLGWKAEQPSLRDQTAAAFLGDMGITSTLFPHENHTALQADCQQQASGGTPELTAQVLESVVLYARTLAVPAARALRDPALQRGEKLFEDAGCASCHVPTLTTEASVQPRALAAQTIHPYTDLLLHDLGEGLSDRRPTFQATGAEWRTAPLWGIGLQQRVSGHTFLLHDGRARDLSEAVLWHGGEAEPAKKTFVALARSDRQALLRFLESL